MAKYRVMCCDAMQHAHESGTDNERYGSLVTYYDDDWPNGKPIGVPFIGDDLPPIQFCPWCGMAIVLMKDED